MSRLVEFGFNPQDYKFSDFATGKRDGRVRKSRQELIGTKNWCFKNTKQARKRFFRSWAHRVDKDPITIEQVDHHDFPRVLRHWNIDERTGNLKNGPEFVIYNQEVEYLTETNTAGIGLIYPDEDLKRPHSS